MASIAVGLVVLGSVACCSAMLAHMEQSATAVERDPIRAANSGGDGGSSLHERATHSVDWNYWQSVNKDVVAWICIPGTDIDYPVVQARPDEPQYYLTHDVYGNWNICGCPYVDATCNNGLDTGNVIIYGHNMGDDSMFGQLVEYRNTSWAWEHREIFLLTPQKTKRLEARGCATVPGATERKRTAFDNRDDLRQYAESKLGSCQAPIPGAGEDWIRLFTLCTCSYFDTPSNERTVVYAFERGT